MFTQPNKRNAKIGQTHGQINHCTRASFCRRHGHTATRRNYFAVADKISADYKKIILGLLSLTLGLVLAFTAKLHVLQLLGVAPAPGLDTLDAIVTGLIISGGTEGINSILKFLKYKKEETKNEAASKLSGQNAAPGGDGDAHNSDLRRNE